MYFSMLTATGSQAVCGITAFGNTHPVLDYYWYNNCYTGHQFR